MNNISAIFTRIEAMVTEGASLSDLKAYVESVRDHAEAAEAEHFSLKVAHAELQKSHAELQEKQGAVAGEADLEAVLLAVHNAGQQDGAIPAMTGYSPEKVGYILNKLRCLGWVEMKSVRRRQRTRCP